MDKPHIRWAKAILNDMGCRVLSSSPQVIQVNPWSEVYRFETDQGFIILKKVPPTLSLESNVIHVLSKVFHADFHDKNILINSSTDQTTLIDLGEVVITHPFFSFLNCIHRAKENFSLSDEQYQQLQFACFKPWLALETQENLFEILGVIQQCWSIHSVLGEFRLMMSVDQAALHALQRQGRLSKNLRYWIINQ